MVISVSVCACVRVCDPGQFCTIQSMPSLKEGHRIGCWKLVAGRFHFAKTGPDDSCTPAFFWTGSVWPQPDSRLEPNRIWVGFVQYDPDCLWKNGTESDVGHWKRGGSILPDPGPKSSAHRVFFPDRIRFATTWQPFGTKPDLGRFRFDSGWPCQVVAKRIRSGSKPVCRNHWARFWQNGTGPLPVFCIQCGPDHIVRHRPGSDLVPDGHVRLCPNGSVLEASRCARIICPGSVKTQPAHFQFPCIRCGSVFPQTAWIILCDLVLDGHVRLWPNGSNTETNRCTKFIGLSSGKTQPACFLFPAFDLVLFFHRRPRSYCAKQAWIQFGSGWPCRVVAKRIRSGSKLICKNHRAWFWQNRTGPVLAKRNRRKIW